MTGPDMMAKANSILKDARLDCLNREAVQRRLRETFPGGFGDESAHAEMRRYALRIFDDQQELDRKKPRMTEAHEDAGQVIPSGHERFTIDDIKESHRVIIEEGVVGRHMIVKSVAEDRGWVSIYLRRTDDSQGKWIKEKAGTPLFNVAVILGVPSFGWERFPK